ncbi:carbon-nitrogen hydrolase family protein [Streptomyces sp. ITFR-16]|uniref:carbon-nitrogen hydrolase family protein n=1 Tax=Streptomyces sp. ITFR-16 TaxID=3075198 RepID=UPI002889B3C8|nr:carbon-nitrogen hydrolase family protein [Streptomyces sp. ITFR-16]WNI20629.1 carbon-nitrogen hydrolase family protein [Streptomyces sp. ITFR-16]
MPETKNVRLAVAQSTVRENPLSGAELRDSGAEVRRLMREARAAGARVVQFPEGATCFPGKRALSVDGPDEAGPADWGRFPWNVLREELAATARLARELGLWTVLGSVHRLTPPHRPHNSLYVLSDRGEVVTRYDERMLSHTKISHLYAPGSAPVTFEVDGVRFGLTLGMEAHFPELFGEYERLDVDAVLFSTTGGAGGGESFATEIRAHAATNRYWAGFAVPAQRGATSPAGIIAPDGEWAARCRADATPSLTFADLGTQDPTSALARPWRRRARAELYDEHRVEDARSSDRTGF